MGRDKDKAKAAPAKHKPPQQIFNDDEGEDDEGEQAAGSNKVRVDVCLETRRSKQAHA